MFSNYYHTVFCQDGTFSVTNSIVSTKKEYACLYFEDDVTYSGDYNDFHHIGGYVVKNDTDTLTTLDEWQSYSGCDVHSLAHDPLFWSPNSTDHDAHLKSMSGTFVSGGWTEFSVQSPCIDAGDPAADYVQEPAPNGARVNIGRYGNTPEASKSRTNGWVLALSYNDGGIITTSAVLRWAYGELAPSDNVNIDFSPDNGVSWSNIVQIPVTNLTYVWDTSGWDNTTMGRWRAVYTDNTNICSETESSLQLHASGMDFYVNDASITGDIYCAVAGSETNSGLTPESPRGSIQSVLADYRLLPGDTVWGGYR